MVNDNLNVFHVIRGKRMNPKQIYLKMLSILVYPKFLSNNSPSMLDVSGAAVLLSFMGQKLHLNC